MVKSPPGPLQGRMRTPTAPRSDPYLRLPAEHHKRLRHSNVIERTFDETNRSGKVIGQPPQ